MNVVPRMTQRDIDSRLSELGELRDKLAAVSPEDVISSDLWKKAVGMLDEMLDSKISVRVPSVTPEERAVGPYKYEVQPNPKAVIPAARMILETRFGRPRQQIEHSGKIGHLHATTGDLLQQADSLFIDRAGSVLDRFALIQRAEPVAQDENPQPAEKQEVVEI